MPLLRTLVAAAILLPPFAASAQTAFKVLATNRTATMEKEMNLAAEMGLRFGSVMGGETAVGGKEVVVIMERAGEGSAPSRIRPALGQPTSPIRSLRPGKAAATCP